MSISGFYRAFEDRHRGSRELIRSRLEVYKPFIAPLLALYEPAKAVDLGCGRGEWLELLRDSGYEPHGVDLDHGMLAACIERDLPVTQGDAVKHLESLEDESQSIVSGFHIAEHVPFQTLDALVGHALRVLKPGGLLILETPNPENLVVGTCNFYLDPTHTRPIPPPLLSFLAEYHGFCRVRVVRLQENKSLYEGKDVELFNVLDGVSPDYSVVAQKAADADVLAKFDAALQMPHGIELHQLASRYDQAIQRTLNELEARLAAAETRATGVAEALDRLATVQDKLVETASKAARTQAENEHLENELVQLAGQIEITETKADAAEAHALELAQRVEEAEAIAAAAQVNQKELQRQIDKLNGNAHHLWQQANRLETECNALRQSWSWKITAPARLGAGLLIHPGKTLRDSANHALHRSIEICQRPLSRLMKAVLRQPGLSYRLNQLLMRYPGMHRQLLDVAIRQGIFEDSAKPIWSPGASSHVTRSVGAEPTQLLLDVTGLMEGDARTGIQRVVRSLLLELSENPPSRFVVRPVVSKPGEQGYRYAGSLVNRIYGVGEKSDGVVDTRHGDIFIGLDLQHASVMKNASYFDDLRSKGVRVYFVVYDLLPVRYPQHFHPEMEGLHRGWLEVIARSDGALCISRTVAKDLRAWIDEHVPEASSSLSIQSFALGSEFPPLAINDSAMPKDSRIFERDGSRPTFLMVGTVEPRKGHALVLSAFEHLWRRGANLGLIILGKPGWMVDDLLRRIRTHPELGERLQFLEDADDRLLELAYRDADCLIAASECEGYGLPLVEAARHGLAMIARDIEAFREVADGAARFFNAAATPEELADCVEVWLELRRSDQHVLPEGIRPFTWADSARQLLEGVDPSTGLYLVGEIGVKDGEINVDQILAGIRRELSSYREGTQ